jgi:prolyl oligopeptidase
MEESHNMKTYMKIGVFLAVAFSEASGILVAGATLGSVATYGELSDLRGEAALKWVAEQNDRTFARLKTDPRYNEIHMQLSKDLMRPQVPMIIGNWAYRFEPNADGGGRWQRQTVHAFRSREVNWTTLVEIGDFTPGGGKGVYRGAIFSKDAQRGFIFVADPQDIFHLDIMEVDLVTGKPPENGFRFRARDSQGIEFIDSDTVLTFKRRGFDSAGRFVPAEMKLWRRGISEPRTLAQGDKDVYQITARALNEPKTGQTVILTRYYVNRSKSELVLLDTLGNKLAAVDLPKLYDLVQCGDQAVIFLYTDWSASGKTWEKGTVLSFPMSQLASSKRDIRYVWRPSSAQAGYSMGKAGEGAVLYGLENAMGKAWAFHAEDGNVAIRDIAGLPEIATVTQKDTTDGLMDVQSFTIPPTLYSVDVKRAIAEPIRVEQPDFDPADIVQEQYWATSRDGTKVPFTVVRNKRTPLANNSPTLVRAYGAYGANARVVYEPEIANIWIAKGGAYVIPNIRGGREFKDWYVTKTERRKVYEDMEAVLKEIAAIRLSSPKKIGIMGLSAGGTLVGVMLAQYSELFNAAVVIDGAMDLLRNDESESGSAAQEIEWGSLAVPAERTFLAKTSPYQNISRRCQVPPFVTTATDDARVFAGQSRRFANRLGELNIDYFYHEHPGVGHGPGDTPMQVAETKALYYTYLMQRLF